jgi:hypothetical protein
MQAEAAGAARSAKRPSADGSPDDARPAGLAHVAAVSFLAARAAPSGGFWVSLAGGTALARAGQRLGARRGYGASLAAMLQSVAIIGPARLGVPLTQAISAPLLGRMEARGHGSVAQILSCAVIRMLHNSLGTAFFVGIVTGLDAYAASYDRLLAGPLSLPTGSTSALVATAAGLLAWSAFGSTVQVLVYRRGLERWDHEPPGSRELAPDRGREAAGRGAEPARRFDPRAVTLAAAAAFTLLLLSLEWALIAAVAAWLALASVAAARPDRDVLPAGLLLAAVLAASALAFAVVGGLGLDLALRRASRAGLLVLVATWLRAAAGSEGLREVSRRTLRRLRSIPSLDDAGRALEELGSTPRLAAAGRALWTALAPVRKRPLPVADAVLGWVRWEAARFEPARAGAAIRVGLRGRDLLLLALAVAPVAALVS